MFQRARTLSLALVAACLLAAPTIAQAGNYRGDTLLDVFSTTDGTQALVASVLVVDGAGVLPFQIADLLNDRRADLVVFAPTNAAFAKLLGLPEDSFDGLSIAEVQAALPGALPSGVGVNEVASILLKHVAVLDRVNSRNGTDRALLRDGEVQVADESVLPVSAGASGIAINYESTVIVPNLIARNGFAHLIDSVILDGLL